MSATAPTSDADARSHARELRHGATAALALGAIGVVFGDIGTSPLYALKECVDPKHGVAPTVPNVFGLCSLVFWAITMVITVKYLTFVMRADNDGEGGILALLALLPEKLRTRGRGNLGILAAVVLFGAALLYGDGIITPAISVLSAMEGLEVAAPSLHRFVVPLTCAVLLALFWVQKRGTARIGGVFGPIMILWFVAIAALGAVFVARNPAILGALSPAWAFRFFAHHGKFSFIILGGVVLAVTGGEALYADMGHFGARAIRLSWYALVWPALVLNYLGQGALLIAHPDARANPFFAMVPTGALTYALVALSTAATVIASQALISGAYSLTRQAVQLGYLPRFTVKHTSSHTEGQIYVGAINWFLAIACILLVVGFGASSRLAAAYGIAVTGTMAITSICYFVVVRRRWHWPLWKALPVLVVFLAFDLPFFGSNLLKFVDGGWVPLLVAVAVFTVMIVWRRGRVVLLRRLSSTAPPFEQLVATLPARVPGTAVFLTAQPSGVPASLVHYVAHAHALQERVVLLHIVFERVPRVPAKSSVTVEPLGHGFTRVTVRVGFMERPCLTDRLAAAPASAPLGLDGDDVTFFLGRESFLATSRGEMGRVSESIFSFLYRNAGSPTAYFELPGDRVLEIGMQIDL